MKLEYVPLLRLQRELLDLPRNRDRFRSYLDTVLTSDRTGVELPSLLVMNPMGREHVASRLDEYLALDADGIALRAVAEAEDHTAGEPGEFKVGLVIADDVMGGWTNRYATEFTLRFGPDHLRTRAGGVTERPRWLTRDWITTVLWESEPASERAVREAVLTAAYRTADVRRYGPARQLRDMLAQEGRVLARAGCAGPTLDAEEIAYTREVLAPFLDSDDMRTAIECLFGDEAGRTLGFTPRGLGPWAGLALALHDARADTIPSQ